jgi:hypothetical protein
MRTIISLAFILALTPALASDWKQCRGVHEFDGTFSRKPPAWALRQPGVKETIKEIGPQFWQHGICNEKKHKVEFCFPGAPEDWPAGCLEIVKDQLRDNPSK